MFRLKEETNFDINNIYIVDESLNIDGEVVIIKGRKI